MNLDKILKDMKKIAKNVGMVQKESFRKKDLIIDKKSTTVDLVTEIDKKSEKMIIDDLKNYYPDFGIIAEEGGGDNKENSWHFVIDPLDGTNNYANGIPMFAVSIGLKNRDKFIAGVVYLPMVDEMFSAIDGKGAYLNDERIKVAEKKELNQAILATGFPYDRATVGDLDNNTTYISRFIPKVRGLRRMGAAAIDISYVAAGFLDGYWEMNLKPWDVAAALVILKESGGEYCYFRDDRDISITAGNPIINKKIIEVLE